MVDRIMSPTAWHCVRTRIELKVRIALVRDGHVFTLGSEELEDVA